MPSQPSHMFQSSIKALRTAYQDLKQDLKATRWRRGLGWSAGVIWLVGLVASAILIGLLSIIVSHHNACLPDGNFSLRPDTYSIWSSSGFFQITLAGGNLNFVQAKVIDIIWDIGIGRGGQLVLATISWRVFARHLTICMESEPVTYRVFRTIFIEHDASLLSTYRTIRSFVWQRKLRSKVTMLFMAVTMIFIVAFPTLMSAMSGYDSNVASRIQDRDGNLISFRDFEKPIYLVRDGSRVNLTDDYLISATYDDPVLNSQYYRGDLAAFGIYIRTYGLDEMNEPSSIWIDGKEFLLDAPTLNISAYTREDSRLLGHNASGALSAIWTRGNETFDSKYILSNGKCQNTGDYKWGFSFLQLFICIIILIAWTVGIHIMWIHTHYTLALRNRLPEEISGEYRAILELAAAMETELNISDIDICLLREQQLKERIAKEIRGGTVAYAYSKATLDVHSMRKGLGTWFKKDKWWLLAMFVTTAISSSWILVFSSVPLDTSFDVSFWIWILLWATWFGQFWGFCIGTTVGSRLLIILFWSFVGGFLIGLPATLYYSAPRH